MDETTLTDLELADIQLATLFTCDGAGRMIADNEPDGEPAPRFFLERTRMGNTWRVRHDVPDHVADQLDALAAAEPVTGDLRSSPVRLAAILDALRGDREPMIGHHGPAYRFPAIIPATTGVTRISRENLQLLSRVVSDLDALDRDFDAVEPWMAVVMDGVSVATCFSVRLSDRAAEVRVDTASSYRGRGYAPAMVAAWAMAVRDAGRIPFYGTSWDNAASQAVARKLGLEQFAVSLAIE